MMNTTLENKKQKVVLTLTHLLNTAVDHRHNEAIFLQPFHHNVVAFQGHIPLVFLTLFSFSVVGGVCVRVV